MSQTAENYGFTATYSPEDNKIRLYAASRLGPELYARVRGAGYIWAPKQQFFVAPMWTPDRADLAVELAGEIGDEDSTLVDRAEERAERFEGYKDARAKDADRAHKAVAAIADGIPLGQPILVGHHSERHARKDAERIENGMRKAVKMWETSKYWQSRAAGAIRHAKYKELPRVRANRIKGLESDRRKEQRQYDEAKRFIRLWAQINDPYLGELLRPGVRSMERQPCDDALRMKRAVQIANLDRVHLTKTEARPFRWSLWGELTDGFMTPREAQLIALKAHGRQIASAKRWIAHLDLRIGYERAMLDEQGATQLLARKPKSAAAKLPLCNYRAPEGIATPNRYNRGEMMYLPQVEMTQAEYAAINQDYKGTRVVDNSHRVRSAMQRHAIVCVFLTDSKVHAKPEPQDPTPAPPLPERTRVLDKPAAPDPQRETFEAMCSTLKAGVQVVSAPQLFPTPPEVARRMVEIADLKDGDCVLEPSAGTGNLIKAVLDAVDTEVLAYEINPSLCASLGRQFPSYKVQVRAKDFLEVTDFAGQYPRVIMNPPFENGADIKHIEHARTMLAPGGVLVAICAAGPRQTEKYADYIVQELPFGTFHGTGVRSLILRIEA